MRKIVFNTTKTELSANEIKSYYFIFCVTAYLFDLIKSTIITDRKTRGPIN